MGDSNNNEVSINEVLSAILKDEALHDISLQGTDGHKVPASRTVLGARSRVLRQMLYGEFVEARSPVIELGYTGPVLKAVVEYIHTDTAHILKNGQNMEAYNVMERVKNLLELHSAAAYFNLSGLCSKTQQCLSQSLQACPSMAFAILEVALQEGPSAPETFVEEVVAHLRYKMKDIDNGNVTQWSHRLLEEILKYEEHVVSEPELFNILQMWAIGKGDNGEGDRLNLAQELSKNLRLELIDAVTLSEVVASSGLVTQSQLLEAFKAQALVAHGSGMLHQNHRVLRWKDSQTDMVRAPDLSKHGVQLLDYPEITSGVHRWTSEIRQVCNCTWLGVVHTGYSIDMGRFAGYQAGGWVYGDGGVRNNDNILRRDLTEFSVGSKVTLTLDLAVRSGTLKASVDGGEQFEVFTGLRSAMEGRSGGFVPVASLRSPGCVRILNIQQVQS